MNLIKWTSRKFEFNFPPEVFPAIIGRLAGTPARLEEIVNSLSKSELVRKIDNSWSVQENIGHLLDIEEFHSKRLRDYLDKKDELSPADITNKKTYDAGYNSKDLTEILQQFRIIRIDYVASLDKIDEETISRYSYHPRLIIPMRLIDYAYFAAEHDDHHIAIMRNIISVIKLNQILPAKH